MEYFTFLTKINQTIWRQQRLSFPNCFYRKFSSFRNKYIVNKDKAIFDFDVDSELYQPTRIKTKLIKNWIYTLIKKFLLYGSVCAGLYA
jgi:hypothetical protein